MYAAVNAVGVLGINGFEVKTEVDIQNGLPSFDLVGLLGTAVREAKERVRAAISNSGYSFPLKRITVNLAPADIHKDGPGFDAAIAIGILAADGLISVDKIGGTIIVGELSLDGCLRPVKGVLSIAVKAKEVGAKAVIVPAENLGEAKRIEGICAYGARTLRELVGYFNGDLVLSSNVTGGEVVVSVGQGIDFADVKGQVHAKRGMEIAAAGDHHVLMAGPPGSGKTMLANRLRTILPPLSDAESLVVRQIYSIAGLSDTTEGLPFERPFRNPHHTVTVRGLIGGGSPRIKPGEISLAHGGVLFLDEFPEFRREAVEALRQPLEEG